MLCQGSRRPPPPSGGSSSHEPLERIVPRGRRLFQQGQRGGGLHWITAGIVAKYRADAHGNERLVQMLRPGEILGAPFHDGDSVHELTAETLTECRIRSLGPSDAARWIERDPAARERLDAQIARDLAAMAHQLVMAYRPVAVRLASALQELAEHDDADGSLTLPMSRRDLAAWIGARPETLTRAVRELEARGVARFERRQVQLDSEALVRITIGSPNEIDGDQ